MVLLSEDSSVKESPGEKQASALVSGEAHLLGGPIFSVKSGLVPGFSRGSEYSVTPGYPPSGQVWHPPHQTCLGYPPKVWTDRHVPKHNLPIILCTQSVKII